MRGEIFSLLGHNGAGKTTTIKMLSGIESASGGSIRFAMARGATEGAGAAALGAGAGAGVREMLSFPGDAQRIRSTMGVCGQHDAGRL